MQLCTWQGPRHSLTSGHVDLSRSEYYNTVANVPAAYAELRKRLGTDQLIWCYTRPEDHIKSEGDTRVPWVLDVPDDRIGRFTDDRVSNMILGIIIRRPRSLYNEWLNSIPVGQGIEYVRRKEAEYHARPAPNGDWWSVLFIDPTELRLDDKDQLSSALLMHPIPEAWVLSIGGKKRTSSGGKLV
jgi:hypothetical protein